MKKYKRDDYIYYIDKNGDHWPGRVVFPLHEKVKIMISYKDEDYKIMRVWPKNLELQSEYKT